MKQQAMNPYLPEWEYIPDGEPYLFNGRVYVYGSHDRFGAPIFCVDDYVCWSAPEDDLGNWRYEGVIFRKNQDPRNTTGMRLLFAPDVAQGTDGRFYLYYAYDFMGIMGVAVCDTPAGQYEFLGHVHYPDGTIYGRRKGDGFAFDPGILVDDDGRVYLYSGFYTPVPAIVTGCVKLEFDGGYVMELEPDMVTIRGEQKLLFPKEGPDSFDNHEFFEASSIRKYDGKYYFSYSSRHNHELCWAVSDHPTEGFRYGGTLISNGDVFLDGNEDETHANNYIGNNHGGLLRLGETFYTFYHRHTNRCSYARQTCAERIERDADGNFLQAEMTSCGLNGGPLAGKGHYPARIACNLWSSEGTGRYDGKSPKKTFAAHPYITQEKFGEEEKGKGSRGSAGNGKGAAKDRKRRNGRQYIANLHDGSTAGFKYFDLGGSVSITATLRGTGEGEFVVSTDREGEQIIAVIPVKAPGETWKLCVSDDSKKGRVKYAGAKGNALYFTFRGTGAIDFLDFNLR